MARKSEPKVRVVNLAMEGTLLPPKSGCESCGTDHEPGMPHNQQSLYWQYWFYRRNGARWPTWHDAMAHCTEDIRARWTEALQKMGVVLPPKEK